LVITIIAEAGRYQGPFSADYATSGKASVFLRRQYEGECDGLCRTMPAAGWNVIVFVVGMNLFGFSFLRSFRCLWSGHSSSFGFSHRTGTLMGERFAHCTG